MLTTIGPKVLYNTRNVLIQRWNLQLMYSFVLLDWSFTNMCNGSITGMVAICAGANKVYPWASILIGLIGYCLNHSQCMCINRNLHHVQAQSASDCWIQQGHVDNTNTNVLQQHQLHSCCISNVHISPNSINWRQYSRCSTPRSYRFEALQYVSHSQHPFGSQQCDDVFLCYPILDALLRSHRGVVYKVGAGILHKYKVDDPVDASVVHLGGGAWGLVSVSLFAAKDSIFYDGGASHTWDMFGWQIVSHIICSRTSYTLEARPIQATHHCMWYYLLELLYLMYRDNRYATTESFNLLLYLWEDLAVAYNLSLMFRFVYRTGRARDHRLLVWS